MNKPTLLWLRRDLRMHDHEALQAAIARGGPVIPVFILSPDFEDFGSAARWRLDQALRVYGASLEAMGARLVLRRGQPTEVLDALAAETGAGAVYWSRRYDRAGIETDRVVKARLTKAGIAAQSFRGFLLFEPWQAQTKQGGMFKVYSPFWRNVRDRGAAPLVSAPSVWPGPDAWPKSDRLEDWGLGRDMHRGAGVVAHHCQPGEAAALGRMDAFFAGPIDAYDQGRDKPGQDATSGMSEYLTYGEIAPRRLWHAGHQALRAGAPGAERFLKEVVWREFAWHLFYHTPHIAVQNWRQEWDQFAWRADNADAEAWRRGMTGEPFVDAAMREMYVTGRMHNRARMIAASYLTKHLLTDWRVGQAWFAECLTDWDPASNAMGWQWVAGSGPDAAPYFRIFNPALQAEKFDTDGSYRSRWIAEGQARPGADALDFFKAAPKAWSLDPSQPYPSARISLAEGRARALAALAQTKPRQ